MRRVVILGSTGSIGESALRVIARMPSELRVVGLSACRHTDRLLEQARMLGVAHVAVADPAAAQACAKAAPAGVQVHAGEGGLTEIASLECDVVLCAVVGMAGLAPTLAAVRNGVDIALATKEVLVAAGGIVTTAARKHGARFLPVDSEHSAIFQCLHAQEERDVSRIILTASGGPFAARSDVDLETVSVQEALDHPRWDMGRKVTVDSATLMNKGLEIMEACWLFQVDLDRIEVVVHPESVVHSMVEFVDGSVMAQLSVPDMRLAIQYALTYPRRLDGGLPKLDLPEIGALHFGRPDSGRFPCLQLAIEAGRRGGTLPAVLNAANEVAVRQFLENQIPFAGIWRTVEKVMHAHDVIADPGLEEIMGADDWARRAAEACRED